MSLVQQLTSAKMLVAAANAAAAASVIHNSKI